MGHARELTRQTKISFGEMRSSGVRGILVYCSDYRCSHSTMVSGDRWPDDVPERVNDSETVAFCI
jgi:hypothetical protein